jgi:DNA-binding XRE family transcriptional regulator
MSVIWWTVWTIPWESGYENLTSPSPGLSSQKIGNRVKGMEQQTAGGEEVTLTEYIDVKRKRAGMTWEQVAGVVGVSDETIGRWRKQDWQPMRLEQTAALIEALKLDPLRVFPDAS